MRIIKPIQDIITFFSDAIARIFGLNDDQYPNVGVQPFEGDTHNTHSKRHRHASDW